jgi:hypothetical protein
MDRAEAEAIYDAGREVCVRFMLDLAARVERLEERLRRLEAQAREDSRTSSKPPSQDPPKTRQQRRAEARAKAKALLARDGARRRAGGQEGHRGAGRRLSPEDQVDEIVDHYPHACRGCGREFGEDERRRGGRCGRHQVAELPPISVLVVEHRTHRLGCPQCTTKTVAELPPEVGGSAFGVRLQAAIVTLTARHRISRRGASELASDLFGAGLSTGAVDAICQRASDALAGPHTQLQDWVLEQDAVHVDETGWRTAGESRALWTMTSTGAASFQIAEHCNREQLTALIGPYPGIVVSDRWPGYEHLDAERRQVCWSHLQRDFRRHSEGLAEQKSFGEHGLELAGRVFGAWRAFCDRPAALGTAVRRWPKSARRDISDRAGDAHGVKGSVDERGLVRGRLVLGVDRRGIRVLVAHPFLDCPHRYARGSAARAERVSQFVERDLADARALFGCLEAFEQLGAIDRRTQLGMREYEVIVGPKA